jgi:hypothetical protein
MASRKRTTRKQISRSYQRFPEVKGKTILEVEIDPDAQAILILFEDKTALSFDLDSSHAVFPELSKRKAGNWKPVKKWRPIQSPISMIKWP